MAVGYSGTPLIKKLGIKKDFHALFVNVPDHYFSLLEPLPPIHLIHSPSPETADFIHLFCSDKAAFSIQSLALKPFLKMNGMFWVSWPKGSSGIASDLDREHIRNFLLANGLVDVKICAIDRDWSGLKFMYRIKDRTKSNE
jgi:hypothetical protein